MFIKGLEQCLVYSKHSVIISSHYYYMFLRMCMNQGFPQKQNQQDFFFFYKKGIDSCDYGG